MITPDRPKPENQIKDTLAYRIANRELAIEGSPSAIIAANICTTMEAFERFYGWKPIAQPQ